MYILKGNLSKRRLLSVKHIRPVSLRIRKSCFDILEGELKDKKILDLFSGTGALGIEALSCGAGEVTFVDIKSSCINIIKKNLIVLKLINKATIYQMDAFEAVKKLFFNKYFFDIIFLDPPYYKDSFRKILHFLEVYDILAPFGYIVGFCYIKDEYIKSSKIFSLILERKYGQTLLLIYKKL